ncbi:DUF2651 family protein [Bacillus vallismortis]|uniref:YbeF family protein n=1 Tax=Bacillus vallismortis TaxID=72361 RepID=A0ABY4Y4W4_BACVA|nr:DUF2651 family protein [Bacillus vallismortis]USP97244.1 YbeF family protein [Bacillus vallismortis]
MNKIRRISHLGGPAFLILLVLPAVSFILGIIGYFIFKRVWITTLIIFVLSLVFMLIEIGLEPTFLIWVTIMTVVCFISGILTKSIAILIRG